MTGVLRPLTGDGLVASAGGLALVCRAPDKIADGLLAALAETAAAGGDGRVLARRTARVLADALTSKPVACAVAGPTQGGLAVLVSGQAAATVTTAPGQQTRLDGQHALTWSDRLFPAPVTAAELTLPGAGPADPRSRLDVGVVPGGGLYCSWAETGTPAPPPAAGASPMRESTPQPAVGVTTLSPPPSPPSRENRAETPFESVLLVTEPGTRPTPPSSEPESEPEPEPESRPLVPGVDCKNGHFNDPSAPYCAQCGISMAQRTLITRPGPRPPLGVLVIDDGTTLRLDTDYLIGRDPERAQEVKAGQARPLRLVDTDGSISRRHVRVILDGWNVNLVDLGSVNGTRVQPLGAPGFQVIPPNNSIPLKPGARVLVGGSRTFRYESHRKDQGAYASPYVH